MTLRGATDVEPSSTSGNKTLKTECVESIKSRERSLLVINTIALTIHLSMLAVVAGSDGGSRLDVDVYRYEANWTSTALTGGYKMSVVRTGTLNYKTMVVGVFLAASLSHAFTALAIPTQGWKALLPTWLATRQERLCVSFWVRLLEGCAPHRWVEYSLSASLQVLLVGVSSGIRDISLLISLVALHVGVMLCGAISEETAAPRWSSEKKGLEWTSRTRFLPFFTGCLLVVSAWTVLVMGIVFSVNDSVRLRNIGAPSIPPWVIAALFGTLLSFFSFAAVHLYYIKVLPSFKRFVHQEMWYQVLSVVSKVYLTGFLMAEVLFREGPAASAGKQSWERGSMRSVNGSICWP